MIYETVIEIEKYANHYRIKIQGSTPLDKQEMQRFPELLCDLYDCDMLNITVVYFNKKNYT